MRERVTLEREVGLLSPHALLTPSDSAREWEAETGGQKVSNTFDVPFRWVCKLQVEESHAKGWAEMEPATGVLVGPRHVLTAAHALDPYYKKPTGQWRIIVRPAFDGSRDLGEEISSDVRVSKGWREGWKDVTDPGAYDYGMIILPSDISSKPREELKDNPLGHWGHPTLGYKTLFTPLKAEYLEGKSIYCAGYPRGMKRAMWVGSGMPSHILFRTGKKIVRRKRGMNHTALASLGEDARGMSGGPVWLKTDSTLYLVGINTSISQALIELEGGKQRKEWRAHAARVTIEFFNEVSEWMKGRS